MNNNKSHMKTLTKIFAGLAMLGTVACQMYEIDTQMTPEKAAASIRMECSAVDTYNLPAQNPGSITFNVSSNTPWTITLSSGADWLNVTPSSSSSSALITDVVVTAKENTGTADRSATLTLRGDNIANGRIITIKQARAGKLFITPMVSDYSAAGGPLSFTIQTNQSWAVRSSEGWLTFNRENGEPDPEGRTITIIATAAASNVIERTATVTVTAGDQEESFDVTQKGTFNVTELSETFASAGGAKTFTIKTDLPWEVSSDKGWLTFDATSGTGDGSTKTITATAAANDGALRKAVVTVSAGGVDKTFEVSQLGFTFEIVAPASAELPRLGGEMTLEVNSSIAWEPSTETAGWTVEKVDATHFKVTAPFNNIFKAKTGTVKISGTGGAEAELELTQDVNFEFSGCEIQDDGSVKLTGANGSKVTFKDGLRCITLTLTMGEKAFGDAGQLWVWGKLGNVNLYNQLSLGGNTRIRTDGNMADAGASSAYKSSSYTITKDELNAMTTYTYGMKPNEADKTTLDMFFQVDGTEKKSHTGANPFYYDAGTVSYAFGFYGATTDGSWYVIKSCDLTVNAENYE
jgi:hypothetical protein